MPQGVYSTRFLSGPVRNVSEATAMRYTVPAGRVAIVRSIDQWPYTAGQVLFGRVVGASFYAITSSVGLSALHSRTWEGHQVFNAGEVMGAQWTSGDVTLTVSGFLLNAVP